MSRFARPCHPIPILILLFTGSASLPVQAADLTPEQYLGGKLDAPIRIEVFSDFQCPACRTLYLDVMLKVLQDYSSQNKVCLIYHEFPLRNHTLSRVAARYSKAAQRLGTKQWRAVMESLYDKQAVWGWDGSVDAVVFGALDKEDFLKLKQLLDDPSIEAAIEREVTLGEKRNVQSTPTFFVYAAGKEQRIVGSVPYRVLKDFFDRTLR
ncbi:MAG: thioredoxin domain-containing protein [Acidobacteria bacterium]|nr:thioredoxin domain-containing protein [Acidobacteriota bacterium]